MPGQISRGQITYPGYEHVKWEATVQKIEHERLFSFTWHPYAIDPKVDYSQEPPTLSSSGWKGPQAERCFYSRNPALAESPAGGAKKRAG